MNRHSAMAVVALVTAGMLAFDPRRSSAVELGSTPKSIGPAVSNDLDRSPYDLATSPNGRWIATANQIANTVSLIDIDSQALVGELSCGQRPVDIEFTPDGSLLLVTSRWGGLLELFSIAEGKLQRVDRIDVGMEPHGIAISPDGKKAYLGLVAASQIAEINLDRRQIERRFDVGQWPRYMTLSPDGSRLAVGNGGDGKVEVVDTASGESLYDERLSNGINFGQMRTSADGKYAYLPWMVYRTNPITVGNIRRGWVLASRIARVRLDGPAYREAISLDVPGKAVADPHDLVISADGQRLVATSSGTHELLVYRLPDLPFVAHGGPGDLIDRRLERDRDRFDRIEVGGRPLGIRFGQDDRTVYVANYLRNSIQFVDIVSKEITGEIKLGGPDEKTLARQGMEVFYDARKSLDQWYSCHSCHQDGGVNSRPMDTLNDGTEMTLKTVLPLYDVTDTFPWTWHGWQRDLTDAMHKSVTSTMQGKPPTKLEKQALIEFLKTMQRPPNPYLKSDGSLSEAAQRGKQVFYSRKAACIDCHHGTMYTDGEIHDVGLGSKSDKYVGYNTPSLVGTYQKVRWLHSGRARSLERVIEDLHSPEKVNGEDSLTEQETADLIEFLKSL